MSDSEPGRFRRLVARIRRIPPVWLVVMAAVSSVLLVWGGVQAYRTWDYVEHNNEFCLSCHLMVDPYERFALSAHSDLGCKACHRPTMVTRSTMALTQILQNPDSLEAHAEVPNDVCVECHVDGDPEQWSNIAASAGHRVHLQSTDTALAGLQCVECHSSSVHEFTATDQTCGQAGCHVDQTIQLGAMGAMTIHCAACHTFNAQVAAASQDSAQLAFQPQREQCLGCHAMQERMQGFPLAADDAHDGLCGACHNPHEQQQPRDAFDTCAVCHTTPETLTPFHRGLGAGVLETCSSCHTAHGFHQEGLMCVACHTDPARPDRVTPPAPVSPHPTQASFGDDGVLRDGVLRMLRVLLLPAPAMAQQVTRGAARAFDHARHTDVECLECHSSTSTHGAVTVQPEDCAACHHSESVAQPCTRCHTEADAPTSLFNVRRAFRPSVGRAENRTYPFRHVEHTQVACATCHREGLQRSAARVNCSSCHTEHHDQDTNCIACHNTPPPNAHSRVTHLTCTGAGCHSPAPVTAAQRTRSLCLACHQTLTDHMPGQRCVDCHALPPATGAATSLE